MICAVCLRADKGFGWWASHLKWRYKLPTLRKFCSKRCQDIYADIMKKEGHTTMIDPTKYEKEAMQKAVRPLGEYVASIGMHRSLDNYTKEEVLTLIEVAVTAYHDHLQQSISEEFGDNDARL